MKDCRKSNNPLTLISKKTTALCHQLSQNQVISQFRYCLKEILLYQVCQQNIALRIYKPKRRKQKIQLNRIKTVLLEAKERGRSQSNPLLKIQQNQNVAVKPLCQKHIKRMQIKTSRNGKRRQLSRPRMRTRSQKIKSYETKFPPSSLE